jgi:2-phosphosulfolactate phosphatase
LLLDWGIEGMRYALKNRNITVVVDTLRFSTAVVTAVARGFTIYPVTDRKSGRLLAASLGAHLAGKPAQSRYSISPHSYLQGEHDENRNIVLFSPNGAACAALVGKRDVAFVACLLNARAVGLYITMLAREKQTDVTVIAAGEQRAVDTGERIVYEKKAAYPVFAIEDYLACGAIVSYSRLKKSAEARVCQLTYQCSKNRLEEFMLDGFSGRYLVQNNLSSDVEHAARLNLYDVIPVIKDSRIAALQML